MSRIIVITGTDTGVGKTLLTALLASHLAKQGVNVAALKPICSGGRDDAKNLCQALKGRWPLDTINPWHFPTPVTPMLAARKERTTLNLRPVLEHLRKVARQTEVLLVEGAGGLLSPLGEDFSTRELISALRAEVMIVAKNQLGVVNHLRLTMEALPKSTAKRAKIILMSPARTNPASRSNGELLSELLDRSRLWQLPYFAQTTNCQALSSRRTVARTLAELLA